MTPALNGSSAIQRFEGSNAIEIRDKITFNFYTGLPHMFMVQVITMQPMIVYISSSYVAKELSLEVNGTVDKAVNNFSPVAYPPKIKCTKIKYTHMCYIAEPSGGKIFLMRKFKMRIIFTTKIS